jgi:hypothetical protein
MVDSELPALLRKDEKSKINLGFVSREQINIEMNALLKQYGATRSQADLDQTRKILKRFGAINDELAAMRDENR